MIWHWLVGLLLWLHRPTQACSRCSTKRPRFQAAADIFGKEAMILRAVPPGPGGSHSESNVRLKCESKGLPQVLGPIGDHHIVVLVWPRVRSFSNVRVPLHRVEAEGTLAKSALPTEPAKPSLSKNSAAALTEQRASSGTAARCMAEAEVWM